METGSMAPPSGPLPARWAPSTWLSPSCSLSSSGRSWWWGKGAAEPPSSTSLFPRSPIWRGSSVIAISTRTTQIPTEILMRRPSRSMRIPTISAWKKLRRMKGYWSFLWWLSPPSSRVFSSFYKPSMHSPPWYWPSQEIQGPLTWRTSLTWGQYQFSPHSGPSLWHIFPLGCSSTSIKDLFCNNFFFAPTTYTLRNRDKKEAFTSTHMACLLLKTTCDCIARITLFSVFMYVQNEGQFSTRMTLIAYYSVFVLLMIFNTWINKNKNFWSAKNLLGTLCEPIRINVNLFIKPQFL